MTAEELLKPRYKVIGDYPNSGVEVGHIYEDCEKFQIEYFEKYPHLFKKMKWFEGLENYEMPEFVKFSKEIYRLESLHSNGEYCKVYCPVYKITFNHNLNDLLPATREEYELQQTANKTERKA